MSISCSAKRTKDIEQYFVQFDILQLPAFMFGVWDVLCMCTFLMIHNHSLIQVSMSCLFNGIHCRQRKQNVLLSYFYLTVLQTIYFRTEHIKVLLKAPNPRNSCRSWHENYRSLLWIHIATSAVCSVSVKAGLSSKSFKCLHDSLQ